MCYDEKFRRRVVKFVRQGGSQREAARRFDVSVSSVREWLKLGDSLFPKKPGPKKGQPFNWPALYEELKKQEPIAAQALAQQFGISHNAVLYALKQVKSSAVEDKK